MGQMHNLRGPARGAKRTSYRPMSEINVTPFVDVMLVLLIVFMVSAPLLTVGVPVDLPRTQAQTLSNPQEPIVVTVDANGAIFVQETEVEAAQITPLLRAITQNNAEAPIYIRGDRGLAYGEVMAVMGRINAAGFARVSLVTDLAETRE